MKTSEMQKSKEQKQVNIPQENLYFLHRKIICKKSLIKNYR